MIRYEDLSLDPFRTTDQLLKYMDLKPNKLIESYLESHTNSKRSGKPTLVKTIRGSGQILKIVGPIQCNWSYFEPDMYFMTVFFLNHRALAIFVSWNQYQV